MVVRRLLRRLPAELIDATTQHSGSRSPRSLVGILIAFPLALLARRVPRLETAILGVSTALYTVPSLALFPLLVPFTGISATTVVIGLALYALTILVRSILDGLRSVPDDVRESAAAWGTAPRRSSSRSSCRSRCR